MVNSSAGSETNLKLM